MVLHLLSKDLTSLNPNLVLLHFMLLLINFFELLAITHCALFHSSLISNL